MIHVRARLSFGAAGHGTGYFRDPGCDTVGIQWYLLDKNQAHKTVKAHVSAIYEIVIASSICGEQIFGRRSFFP